MAVTELCIDLGDVPDGGSRQRPQRLETVGDECRVAAACEVHRFESLERQGPSLLGEGLGELLQLGLIKGGEPDRLRPGQEARSQIVANQL